MQKNAMKKYKCKKKCNWIIRLKTCKLYILHLKNM